MADDVNITSETTRAYLDNFSVKEHGLNTIIPKYFTDDLDLTHMNVGLQGFVSEQMAEISQDVFNTSSVLMREAFPIRAQIPESIYSHAAVFQLSDTFGQAGYGEFYMSIDQRNLINNFITIDGTNYFYIDKDTTVMVDGIPFVLDYDIEIKAIKREYITQTQRSTRDSEQYIFTARYVTDGEYVNSLSEISNPYIRVREYSGDYNILILNVLMRQCTRTVVYESLTTNATINYPVVDVPFTGILAGFDIVYRKPTETEFTTQLEKRVAYSLPTKTPFCYYRLKDSQTLQIFFTSRDTYFQPEFNSELKIIMYTTMGEKGNFTSYSGNDLLVRTTTERYSNNVSFALSARPVAGVIGGKSQATMDELQAYTVEGYSTAMALTTEPDLDIYFENYHYRYGGEITCIKKRNDVRERLYGAYIVMKQDSYIYPTNTLHFHCNLDEFTKTADGRYVLEPGHLFKYIDSDSTDTVSLYKNPDKVASFHAEYEEYIAEHPYRYDEETDKDLPDYMKGPIRYEEWMQTIKQEHDDYLVTDEEISSTIGTIDNPHEGFQDFLYTNPFLILFSKTPNLIGIYLTQVSEQSELDFTWQNQNAFVQWNIARISLDRVIEQKKKYHVKIQTTANIDSVSMYREAVVTGTGFNNRDTLKDNDLRIFITILDNEREVCYTELVPTEKNADGIYTFETDLYTDDHITSNSMIRILDTADGETMGTGIVGNIGMLDDILIPIDDVELRIYTMYNKHFSISGEAVQEPVFKQYIEGLDDYHPTNIYATQREPLTFIKPLNDVRCHLAFEDYMLDNINVGDCIIRSVPFVKYDLLDQATHAERWSYFLAQFMNHYEYMDDIIVNRLRNASHIDMKFYNSYGRSNNFQIGEGDDVELINTVTPKIYFDVWIASTADAMTVTRDLKIAIKDYVEEINKESGFNLFISNLIHYIEENFVDVDHLRFRGIGDYSTLYQAVKNITKDADTMTRDQRRYYVPEILNIDLDNIFITVYTV